MTIVKYDRVRCIKDYCERDRGVQVGDVGTVLGHKPDSDKYMVEWDRNVKGHDACGARYGHGWYTPASHLELIDDIDDIEVNDISGFYGC